MAGERLTRSPFSGFVGAHLEETGEGYVRVSLAVGPEHTNPYGVMHGGVVTTLMDSSMGVLISVMRGEEVKDRPHATVEMNASFLGVARPGDEIVSEARIVRLGKRFAVGETEARRRSDGELVALGRFTFVIRDRRE